MLYLNIRCQMSKKIHINPILKLAQDAVYSIHSIDCHCWCLYIFSQSCPLVGTKKLVEG